MLYLNYKTSNLKKLSEHSQILKSCSSRRIVSYHYFNKRKVILKAERRDILTNIIDGMDAARFKSGNPTQNKRQKKEKEDEKKMPMVLKNLKNGS
jgi:hypothetical protein